LVQINAHRVLLAVLRKLKAKAVLFAVQEASQPTKVNRARHAQMGILPR
jgi:hypothetical protein